MNFEGPKRRGGHPKKYELTPERREDILRSYDSCNRREIAARLGVPSWVVGKWAVALGVARTKERCWTQQDLFYLEEHLYTRSWKAIARHLGRTPCAVKLKAKRLGLGKLSYREGITGLHLARLLGVDSHVPTRWVADGKLRGRRRATDRTVSQGGDAWLFTHDQLRAFIATHPEEIDLRRVDKSWFLELLVSPWRAQVRAA